MALNLLIKNCIPVTSGGVQDKKDILLQEGVISAIEDAIAPGNDWDVLDAQGNYLLPGLVDICTEICDPGYEHREDIHSVSRAAVSGGFTSLASQCNTNPVIDNKTLTSYIVTKAKAGPANIYPCGCMAREGYITEIGEMLSEGAIAISDGGVSVQDSSLMLNILEYSRMFDVPVIVSCEDKSLAGEGVINKGRMSTLLGLRGIPREAEELMVARNLLLARKRNTKMHILTVTTQCAVDIVRSYKKSGMQVTCGTNPQYFTLTEEELASYDTLAKIKPPLRTHKDLESVIEGIADGTIDVISSGHVPVTIDSKRREFVQASYGISSLETAFAISYTKLVKNGLISLERLVNCMSSRPAEILGLHRKGDIQIGFDGDLFICAKEGSYKIDGASFASMAKFTPYQGWQANGEILYTLVDGKMVYDKRLS